MAIILFQLMIAIMITVIHHTIITTITSIIRYNKSELLTKINFYHADANL